ncbi:hypothetical protein CDAR_507531 [Caerostris darwini]|uniref:Uncharacterized protein n=1 Tax=Caerostris darwini TaxID=1538125 RepID=A0AAV4MYZ7_9ARAC|nr:hypothetical protein CDAR_507531 [Caerostris darwini]
MPADRWCGGIRCYTCIVNSIVGSLRDRFLQISTKRSCPISSRRRRACFANLSQYERNSVWRYEAGCINIKHLSRLRLYRSSYSTIVGSPQVKLHHIIHKKLVLRQS